METNQETTTAEGQFTCKHCTKTKNTAEGVEKDGEMYCCDQCHARGPVTTTPPNTCEFC